MKQIKLVVQIGENEIDEILLGVGSYIIGRSNKSDVVFNDPRISRSHCKITVSQSEVIINDLGSSNGTFVNTLAIEQEEKVLISGDVIELGNSIRISYVDFDQLIDTTIKIQKPQQQSDVVLNTSTKEVVVSWNDDPIQLTRLEYSIFELLYSKSNSVCSRDEIYDVGWPDYEDEVNETSIAMIDTIIRRLRKKIEPDPSAPKYILTRRGHGYILDTNQ